MAEEVLLSSPHPQPLVSEAAEEALETAEGEKRTCGKVGSGSEPISVAIMVPLTPNC